MLWVESLARKSIIRAKVVAIANQRWAQLITPAVISLVETLLSIPSPFVAIPIWIVTTISAPVGPIRWIVRKNPPTHLRLAATALISHQIMTFAIGVAHGSAILFGTEA